MPFFAGWSLFAEAWLASWLIAGLLSLLGVAVLARGQVFLGAAMGQGATAAIALVLWGFAASPWRGLAEILGAMGAALVTALAVGASRHREALAAWIFLAGGAGSVLLVARSPLGLDEVNRLLASSLVGAKATDVVVFAGLLLGVVGLVLGQGPRLRAVLLDPVFARTIGIRVHRWEVLLAVLLGLSLGWSLHVAGLLYTFGALVLPAMAARQLCRDLATMAWLTPMLAVATAIAGTAGADVWDLPPGQVVVVGWAAVVALAAGFRTVVRR